jgi:hypothetical protein
VSRFPKQRVRHAGHDEQGLHEIAPMEEWDQAR